jgi:hypothetical protein
LNRLQLLPVLHLQSARRAGRGRPRRDLDI